MSDEEFYDLVGDPEVGLRDVRHYSRGHRAGVLLARTLMWLVGTGTIAGGIILWQLGPWPAKVAAVWTFVTGAILILASVGDRRG